MDLMMLRLKRSEAEALKQTVDTRLDLFKVDCPACALIGGPGCMNHARVIATLRLIRSRLTFPE